MEFDRSMVGVLISVLLIISSLGFMSSLGATQPNYNSSTELSALVIQANSTYNDINATTLSLQSTLNKQSGITQIVTIITSTAVSGVKIISQSAPITITFGQALLNMLGLPAYWAGIFFVIVILMVVGLMLKAYTGSKL